MWWEELFGTFNAHVESSQVCVQLLSQSECLQCVVVKLVPLRLHQGLLEIHQNKQSMMNSCWSQSQNRLNWSSQVTLGYIYKAGKCQVALLRPQSCYQIPPKSYPGVRDMDV